MIKYNIINNNIIDWSNIMELNDVKIFIELYNNRSISKTAKKLNYTQSNVSTRLMKLEQEFNTSLFIRTKSGLQLLPATDRFYNYAKKIEESVNDLYREFSLKNQQINIGSTQLLSKLFFPALYLQKHPFVLHTTSSNKLCRNFNNNIFDIAITHTQLDTSESKIQLDKTENLSWASSVNYKNNDNKTMNIIINRDKQCPLRELTIETTHSLHSNFSFVEVDTLDLMLSLIYTSDCIALLPQKLIEEDMRLATYNYLPSLTLNVFLYCHKNIDEAIITDCFINELSFNITNQKKSQRT